MLILLSALLACTSGNDLGTNATAHIDALRTLVEEHADAVSTLANTSEIAALEADYDVSYDSEMTDMTDMMDGMMSCMGDMMGSGDMSDMMGDMSEHMDEMGGAHDAHGDSISSCADMSACADMEADHMDAMMEHLDGLETDMGSWDDEMSCSEGEHGDMSM